MSLITLDHAQVREYASMKSVIEAVKLALIDLERGEFELPLRLPLGKGESLIMPVFHKPTRSSATKVLSLDPDRNPFITGVVAFLASGSTDTIIADSVPVTTLRTGAIVGAAVDLLAPSDVETLMVFGAGAQAFDQVRGVLAVRTINRVFVSDQSQDRAAAAVTALSKEFPDIKFAAEDRPRDRLPEADVICCATTSASALFSEKDLSANVVVTAIGAYRPDMHELPQDLLGSGCPVYVDDLEACLKESGEIVQATKTGLLTKEKLTSLGKALTEVRTGEARSVFKSVGVAVQDWAVMHVLNNALLHR